jgi:hypothetical protein
MAGRDKSSKIDDSSRRRLAPEDKGSPITGFREMRTMAIPSRAAPRINRIPLQRKAISVVCIHPFSYDCIFPYLIETIL